MAPAGANMRMGDWKNGEWLDTEDQEVFPNAVKKVCGFVYRNVTVDKMSGTLQEESSDPSLKMVPYKVRWCAFAKTWLDNQYDVLGQGKAPTGANMVFGE